MGRSHRLANERGFTFIEVMIAMFILSFIAGGMAMVSSHASNSSAYASRLAQANMIAEAALEWSRNAAFESLNTARTETVKVKQGYVGGAYVYADAVLTETCVTTAPVTTCTQTGNPPYTRTRTVEYRTTGVAATSFTAATTVTVSWAGARGETQRVAVASVISKY